MGDAEVTQRHESELARLQSLLTRAPWDGQVAEEAIRRAGKLGRFEEAKAIFSAFEKTNRKEGMALPHVALAAMLLDAGQGLEAVTLLRRTRPLRVFDVIEAALLLSRAGDHQGAWERLAEREHEGLGNLHFVVQFAFLTKRLADRGKLPEAAWRAMTQRSVELHRHVLTFPAQPKGEARAWVNLAGALARVRAPEEEIDAAYLRARALVPRNERVVAAHERWKTNFARWKAKHEKDGESSWGPTAEEAAEETET